MAQTIHFPGFDPPRFATPDIFGAAIGPAERRCRARDRGDRKSDDQAANLPVDPPSVTQTEAARLLNVSERSVRAAKAVQETAALEIQHAVEQGKLSVSAAAEVAELPQEEQRHLIAQGEKTVVTKAKEIRATKPKRKHTRGPSIVAAEQQESQHDRDVRLLRGVWEAACESARAEFLRSLGYEPVRGAA